MRFTTLSWRNLADALNYRRAVEAPGKRLRRGRGKARSAGMWGPTLSCRRSDNRIAIIMLHSPSDPGRPRSGAAMEGRCLISTLNR